LAEIDCGISERPFNIDNFFPRRSSIEEIPDSPNSNEDAKISSAKDSAYSGSSAGDKEIQKSIDRTEKAQAAESYINVLKEISCGLVGFADEPLVFNQPPVKVERKKAQATTEPSKPKEVVKENYTKVLKDISSTLVGLDLHGVETKKEKNYSQIIPPFVQDREPMRRVPSANNLEVPYSDRIHEFHPDTDEVTEIQIPVPPVRRHRSVESSEAPEPRRRFLPNTKSFDFETVSGRTSKNSTEYYDHYYPTSSGRRLEKYDSTARKESFDGGARIKTRQRAIDDLMVKSSSTRMYEADDAPIRRQVEYRREDSEPSDANALLERSHMLHRRKESFMRGQMNESNNPYIREMMKQDCDNPIDISDIKFIRNNPTTKLPTTSSYSHYQRPASYVPSVSTRTPITYGKPSISHTPITSSSYSRSSAVHPVTSYKSPSSSVGYLSPISRTAEKILTKSHTMSTPHSGLSTSYSSRSRPITSLSDPTTRITSSHQTHPTSYSHKKSSGSSRDACVIS
jgi:hypothetical protein